MPQHTRCGRTAASSGTRSPGTMLPSAASQSTGTPVHALHCERRRGVWRCILRRTDGARLSARLRWSRWGRAVVRAALGAGHARVCALGGLRVCDCLCSAMTSHIFNDACGSPQWPCPATVRASGLAGSVACEAVNGRLFIFPAPDWPLSYPAAGSRRSPRPDRAAASNEGSEVSVDDLYGQRGQPYQDLGDAGQQGLPGTGGLQRPPLEAVQLRSAGVASMSCA